MFFGFVVFLLGRFSIWLFCVLGFLTEKDELKLTLAIWDVEA
jgi:hypothetical protein